MEANITQVELVYFYTFRSILHSKNLVIPNRIRGNTKTERMVKLLSENILTTGRYIYLDNYYVIYQLFKYFSQQNIKATGTARIDRIDLHGDLRNQIVAQKLPQNSALYYISTFANLLLYFDRQATKLLTNAFSDDTRPKYIYTKRRNGGYRREEIDVPITVMEYNKNTHGVD